MKRDLISKAKDPTDAVLGMTLEGQAYHLCLSEGPHWLVCGQTGSGKSVFLNSMILSLLYHATPNELQIFIVDPKFVDFKIYIGLPYCPCPPAQIAGDAYGLLQYLTWLMDERYKIMSSVFDMDGTLIKNLNDFNDWYDNNTERAISLGFEKMKYTLLIIDEFSDLVGQDKGGVESCVIRLAQKSRACGIHVIISTQRPSADVITGTIKANIPSRIALKVTSTSNSMIILDEPGAEKLGGYGDALVQTPNGITRCKGPFFENKEMENIFNYLKKKYPPPTFIDYKQICVDNDLMEWEAEYAEDTKWSDKHVVGKKRRGGLW